MTIGEQVAINSVLSKVEASTQEEIISQLCLKLKTLYIFPDVAEQVCARLYGYLPAGEYT